MKCKMRIVMTRVNLVFIMFFYCSSFSSHELTSPQHSLCLEMYYYYYYFRKIHMYLYFVMAVAKMGI